MAQVKSLGLVKLDDHTVEHDFTMLARFQEFSAELLRLALLGISAIGFVASKLLFPGKDSPPPTISGGAKMFLAVALFMFCVATAGSLLHRYVSADSMSWHIQAMRRYKTGDEKQADIANREAKQRFKRFKMSQKALSTASLGLATGAIALALAAWLSL